MTNKDTAKTKAYEMAKIRHEFIVALLQAGPHLSIEQAEIVADSMGFPKPDANDVNSTR